MASTYALGKHKGKKEDKTKKPQKGQEESKELPAKCLAGKQDSLRTCASFVDKFIYSDGCCQQTSVSACQPNPNAFDTSQDCQTTCKTNCSKILDTAKIAA